MGGAASRRAQEDARGSGGLRVSVSGFAAPKRVRGSGLSKAAIFAIKEKEKIERQSAAGQEADPCVRFVRF